MVHYDFIEIGTSDFDTLIENANDDVVGLSFEIINFYLDKLPNKKNILKINKGVSNINDKVDVYYIHPDIIKKYNLPNWIKGCNTINKYHDGILMELEKHKLDPQTLYSKTSVDIISFDTLINTYNVTSISYLKVDTEGHDCVILNSLFDYYDKHKIYNILPKKILFESNYLTDINIINSTILRALQFGYKVTYQSDVDTIIEL